ncbi:hypothetical protein Cni_G16097 [Canna indica]|uniref:Uncharacterized protein n=1 Tax=Canna indica TaxID=4628 RepID=A0AAQ3KFP9_9LILI|nr:hypothetical protein Cni_G16097 [Canna indica]
MLVTARGQLHQQADVVGFLARQFHDNRQHLQHWKQRKMADGRFLITTPEAEGSYYKRCLIYSAQIQWNHVMLQIDDWKQDELYLTVPPPELLVGLELRGLPIMF